MPCSCPRARTGEAFCRAEYDAERATHARKTRPIVSCWRPDGLARFPASPCRPAVAQSRLHGDLTRGVDGTSAYQGQGRARLRSGSIAQSAACAIRRVLVLIIRGLCTMPSSSGWLTRQLRRSAHLPCGGRAVQAGGICRPARESARTPGPEVRQDGAAFCCKSGKATRSRRIALQCRSSLNTVPGVSVERRHFYRVARTRAIRRRVTAPCKGCGRQIDTHLGRRAALPRPRARACRTGISPWLWPAGAGFKASLQSKNGARSCRQSD